MEKEKHCIFCKSKHLNTRKAKFAPFIEERMFAFNPPSTQAAHCSHCGIWYSTYRPNELEMARFYSGYRDEHYQKQREKYEPFYTKEFNYNLGNDLDIVEAKKKFVEFIIKKQINTEKITKVLDYGGDMGQYIPDCFSNAEKFVYEISNVPTIDGVKNISEEEITNHSDFDFVMCLHVLEHVAEPMELVKKICSYCKKGGYIYIEVPVDGAPFENDYIHEHISIFSDRTFLSLWNIQNDITLIDVNTCFDKIYVLMQKKKCPKMVKFFNKTIMELKLKVQKILKKHPVLMNFINFIEGCFTKIKNFINDNLIAYLTKFMNFVKKIRIAYLLTKQIAKTDRNLIINKKIHSINNSIENNKKINVVNLFEEEFQDEFKNLDYLKKYNFNITFEKLKQKLKDKKIIFYGGGLLLRVINKYYNLTDLNVIGIADKKLSQKSSVKNLYGYKIYKPEDIKNLKPDYVVISTKKMISIAEDLYFNYLKGTDIKIIPLVIKSFWSIYKEG